MARERDHMAKELSTRCPETLSHTNHDSQSVCGAYLLCHGRLCTTFFSGEVPMSILEAIPFLSPWSFLGSSPSVAMDLPGLNFRPGKVVEAEILRKFGTSVCVHPSFPSKGFFLVLSFGRCKFRLFSGSNSSGHHWW